MNLRMTHVQFQQNHVSTYITHVFRVHHFHDIFHIYALISMHYCHVLIGIVSWFSYMFFSSLNLLVSSGSSMGVVDLTQDGLEEDQQHSLVRYFGGFIV